MASGDENESLPVVSESKVENPGSTDGDVSLEKNEVVNSTGKGNEQDNSSSGPAVSSSLTGDGNKEDISSEGQLKEDKSEEKGNGDLKSSENGNEARSSSRPVSQPTKRRPDKELNHDNWDEEDEPEEKGEFVKASEDKLKERKILTAKRKQKPAGQASSNPFGSINIANAFGSGGTGNVASMFNFASPGPQSLPAVPKFDFGSLTSYNKSSNESVKADSDSTENSSSKKQRKEEPEDSSASATTV